MFGGSSHLLAFPAGISDGFDGFAARNCHGESGQLRMIDERHRSSVKRLRDCDEDGEEDEGQRQGSAQLNCATRRVMLKPIAEPARVFVILSPHM